MLSFRSRRSFAAGQRSRSAIGAATHRNAPEPPLLSAAAEAARPRAIACGRGSWRRSTSTANDWQPTRPRAWAGVRAQALNYGLNAYWQVLPDGQFWTRSAWQ